MPELIKTILANSANLKAYYRFESGNLTVDSSGNSHTLTNNNTVAEGTGVFGGSADLELSSSQYFSLASHADLNFGTGEFAFGGWFKKESNAINGGLAVKIAADDSDGWRLTVNGDNTLSFFVDNGAFAISTSSVTDTSNYYHVVISRVSGLITMYLNGAKVASGSSSIDMDSTSALHFGTYRSNAANYFDGMLDDWFFIKGSGLSADQIKELYEGRYLGELRPNQFGTTAGLWHLNGNSTDFSGNNNHGTPSNITWVQGLFGQAASFNGSNSLISISDSASISITNNITLMAWVKRGAASAGQHVIFGKSNYSGNQYSYQFEFFANQIGFRWSTVTSAVTASAQFSNATFTSTTAWYHVAATMASGTCKIYVNGAEVPSTFSGTLYTSISDTASPLAIGCQNYPSAVEGQFNGVIDEPMISSTALTANQIRTMYALGVGKYY